MTLNKTSPTVEERKNVWVGYSGSADEAFVPPGVDWREWRIVDSIDGETIQKEDMEKLKRATVMSFES